jgi:dipeptidyl aminopeptidase/acylaminoacyl peptidase
LERIPIESFIKEPAFDEIRLSPDGTRISALARWKGHLQLFVIDLKTKKPRQITGYDLVDVDSVTWRDNQTLCYTTIDDHCYTGRWFLAAADGSKIEDEDSAWHWGITIHSSPEHPDDHILGEYSLSENSLFIYRYNDKKHGRTLSEKIPKAWVAYPDNNEEFRIALGGLLPEETEKKGPDAKFERFVYTRTTVGSPWRKVFEWRYDQCTFDVIGYTPDNRYVYVVTDFGRNTSALVLFDPEKGEIVRELLSDPLYDVDEPRWDRGGKTLLGYDILRNCYETVWFDENLKKLQLLLDQELPGHQNYITSMSEDRSKVIFLSKNDRDKGTYFLVDAKSLEMQTLVQCSPWLPSKSLAEMKPIEYKARDGLIIHGYLTLPPGAEPKNLPLIVYPHGGPWMRDSQGFDTEVQFFANRGYAVLQMNFRGSTGYGRAFLNAGVGEWGLRMQDDITDGVKYIIAEGIADPHRIAIYGSSYGGFAALAGLAQTPELYRCGVSYVGVTDIELFFKTSIPWELKDPGINMKLIGNPKYDLERFREVSPLRLAKKIHAPVFLAYGELDGIVDFKHGTRMAAALRKRGVPVEWMIRSQEGHGYVYPENLKDYFTTLEAFLAKNLSPSPEH